MTGLTYLFCCNICIRENQNLLNCVFPLLINCHMCHSQHDLNLIKMAQLAFGKKYPTLTPPPPRPQHLLSREVVK